MGLSDSRPMPAHGYLFPPAVGRVATPAPPGIPVSSTNLSLCAVPNHPEKPSGVLLPLFHHWWQASPSLAGWPSFNLRHEAESGSLSLRLTGSPHEASPSGLLRSTLVRLHVERVIHMVDSFHSTRFASLLAHQRRKGTPGFLCAFASSMRRSVLVKQNLPFSSLNPLFGAGRREAGQPTGRPTTGPFPSSMDLVPGREGSVKGARFWPRLANP